MQRSKRKRKGLCGASSIQNQVVEKALPRLLLILFNSLINLFIFVVLVIKPRAVQVLYHQTVFPDLKVTFEQRLEGGDEEDRGKSHGKGRKEHRIPQEHPGGQLCWRHE